MIDSLSIAHDSDGSGTPVVLLHAGVCDRRMWDGMRDAMPPGWRFIVPDLPGFGQSPLPPRGTSYTDAGLVAALLDELDIASAHVIGASYGGRVAMELAMIRPDLVRSLALLCPALRGLEPTAALSEFAEAEDALLENGDLDAATELNVDTWLSADASPSTRDFVRRMQRRAFELQWADPEHPGPDPVAVEPGRIGVPALVVLGEDDVDHFVVTAEHLAVTVPDARLERLPQTAHLPAVEDPVGTAHLIAAWLDDQENSRH